MRKFYYMLIFSMMLLMGQSSFAQSVIGTLPYHENFDSYEVDEYTNFLPDGWKVEGDAVMKVGHHNSAYCKPYSAPYYMVIGYDTKYPRRDWLYTLGFNLEGGKTYYANFHIFAAGYTVDGNVSEVFKFTAGLQQTAEAQTEILFESEGKKYKEWTKITGHFTPETSGVYYFGFNFLTPGDSNGIGIDNFEVYSEDNPLPVIIGYKAKGGYWSILDKNMKKDLRYIYPDQPITFINESEYATDYRWETFGNPSVSEEVSPQVYYTQSGYYEPVLIASNKGGTETHTEVVNVVVLGEEEYTDKISNHDKYDGNLYYSPIEVEDLYYEYVTGFNRYYSILAEKFDIPSYARLSVNSLSLMLYTYKVAVKDQSKTVNIRIYGDGGGVPDENNIFGTYTTTLKGAFGINPIVEVITPVTIRFDKPIEVTGTFYVSIEFDESLEATSTTHIGWMSFGRWGKETSAFIYIPEKEKTPTPLLGVSPGWYLMDEMPYPLDGFEGLSFFLSPEVTFHKVDLSAVEKETVEEIGIYPTVFDDFITINIPDSEIDKVSIYNLNGQKVYETLHILTGHTIPTSDWNSGIYIVNVESNSINRSIKVVKL